VSVELEGGDSHLLEFEFDQVYPGKHTVKFIGVVTFDGCLIGCHFNTATNNCGYFRLQPLPVLQFSYQDLRGHGPILLNPHINSCAYSLELSDSLFVQMYELMHYFVNILKESTSLEEITRTNYGLNIILELLKCHAEGFQKTTENHRQLAENKDLSKYEHMSLEEIRESIKQDVDKIETEKERIEQEKEKEKQEREKEKQEGKQPTTKKEEPQAIVTNKKKRSRNTIISIDG